MLCEVCHKREAAAHMTNIAEDAVTTRNLCEECFGLAEPAQTQELSSAFHAGCRYCQGEPVCTAPDLSAGPGGGGQVCALCARCAQEFYRYALLQIPGIQSGQFTPDQKAQIPAAFAAIDQHMRKWVSERDSQ
jgi:hypothetical protein